MLNIETSVPPHEYVKEPTLIAQALQSSSLDTQYPLVHELEASLEPPVGIPSESQPTLRNRVDDLEERISELEVQQVSPVVKLSGKVIFGISDVTGREIDEATTFQRSIELIFDASFTGEDRLEIGIESGRAEGFQFNDEITPEGQLEFFTDTGDNDFELSELSYSFPIGDRGSFYISTTGDDLDDFNPVTGDAISEFGSENPIHSLVEDVGVQFNYDLTDHLNIGIGYFADEASNPEIGLFNGNYATFAQLAFEPNDDFLLGLTYIHTYNDESLETDTGSFRSQIDLEQPVVGNSYGVSAAWEPTDQVAIGGWVGYTNARVINEGDAYILNYALTLAFEDLGRAGNALGLVIGQEPKLLGTSGFTIDDRRRDPDTSFHIEAFYTHEVNDFLSITPDIVWLTAPDHNNDNDDIIVFTMRTTFDF